jgi:hypothetical protein
VGREGDKLVVMFSKGIQQSSLTMFSDLKKQTDFFSLQKVKIIFEQSFNHIFGQNFDHFIGSGLGCIGKPARSV